MYISGIDDIDNKLLTLLRENARYTYSELASKVGLSRIAVRNRITDMEEIGLIRGYEVKIAPKKVDNSVSFIVNVSPKTEHYDYILGLLGKSSMITQLYGITGDCRITAFGVAPSSDEMDAYYQKLRRIFTDVRYFSFDVIASTYKDVDGGIEYGKETINAADAGGTDQ